MHTQHPAQGWGQAAYAAGHAVQRMPLSPEIHRDSNGQMQLQIKPSAQLGSCVYSTLPPFGPVCMLGW